MLRRVGTLLAIGCLPEQVRDRFAINWSDAEQCEFRQLAFTIGHAVRILPERANQRALLTALRAIGAKTRHQRYRPTA